MVTVSDILLCACEQETLYAEVLPALAAQLETVLSEHR